MNELMSTGFEIMLVGMGSVFLFLAMLIVAVNIMAATIQRYFPEPPPESVNTTPTIDPHIIAAVSAAVHQHRQKHTQI
jgi:oxaloacetate decarboxylase gamma subunit